jgi:hypothetical protein
MESKKKKKKRVRLLREEIENKKKAWACLTTVKADKVREKKKRFTH